MLPMLCGSTAFAQQGQGQVAPLPADQQILSLAGSYHQRATNLSRQVASRLDDARRNRDQRRTQCLDTTLTQTNSTLRMLSARIIELQRAVGRRDASLRNHLHSVLGVLSRRVDALSAQSDGCIGHRRSGRNGTHIVIEIDSRVPREDPTALSTAPPADIPMIPPPLSPAF